MSHKGHYGQGPRTAPRRILLVHNRYQQAGGEDRVFEAETTLLESHGDKPNIFRRDNEEINLYGLSEKLVLPAKTLWSWKTHRALERMLGEVKPDVVHFHNTFPLISPSGYFACWGARIPVLQTLHNYRLLCPNAIFYRDGHVCEDCLKKSLPWPGVVHSCYRRSRTQTAVVAALLTFHRLLKTWKERVNIYISLTQFARRKFIEGGLPAEKIVVKPNFVHPDPGMREGGGDYLLYIGRLSPEKGLLTVLSGWKLLKNIPLKMVGNGPLMHELRRRTQKLPDVELLGRRNREEVISLLKGARFLLFPSEWYECFPVTLVEAFACGVPVIASRLGAMAEIVEDGHTGLHFAPGDSEDLAAKVEWAWNHPENIREMGREARAEHEAKYTAERNYQTLMEIYQKAMEAKR